MLFKQKELDYKIQALAIEQRKSTIESIERAMEFVRACSRNEQLQECDAMFFRETMLNTMRNDAHIPTNQSNMPKLSGNQLTLSTLLASENLRFDSGNLQKLGLFISKKYVEKYNQKPEKHEQHVNGAIRLVNTYYEKDRAFLLDCINKFKY